MSQQYFLGGVNAGVFSDTQMVVEPFSLWMFGVNQIIDLPTTLYPDLTRIGINGMDANPNGAGKMPPDGAYDLYALYNPATAVLGFIVSLSPSIAGVAAPAGFTSYRKISYGVVVRSGKLAANHCSNWPMPTITFTDQILVASFLASATWAPIDLSKLIPENSRMGHFRIVITGAASNVWLAPSSTGSYAKLFAYNEQGVKPECKMRVDSNEKLYVKFEAGSGGRLDVYLDGFDMTEVD